jgi:tRNA-splicing ligase RtcB
LWGPDTELGGWVSTAAAGTVGEPYNFSPVPREENKTGTSLGVAQPGSALALGARGRRFKSCHPDSKIKGNKQMRVISTEKVPIKLWSEDIEEKALQQAMNLANLPFVFKWVAVMADGHPGFGMPIGGVMATRGVVVPNCVGSDIGCGMCAVKTSLTDISTDSLKAIMGKVRSRVPLGFGHHKEKMLWLGFDAAPNIPVVQEQLQSATRQLGTLGGGNHFIEIQKGSDGFVWFMLHSGSRNFGLKIATEYHNKAKVLCERWCSDIPDKDLSFLPIETKEAKEYFEAMNFALSFAKENRFKMMRAIQESFLDVIADVSFDDVINVHHNYAAWENHFGENVIVHRKGATSARAGEIGIIPGSQGTKSYIVKGKGNPESFTSCSHGAGRKMGRKQAQRELNLEEEMKRLDDQGIIHAIRGKSDLDEAAGAYKDIGVVMKNQSDLVDIVVELSPLAVIKA